MARKPSQDSYSDADYGYEEDFSYEEEEEPEYEKKGFFSRFRRKEIDEDDVYEDESYDDDYDEYEDEEEEEPRRGFFKSFGRKKKEEPEYEEVDEEYEEYDEGDAYDDEYEDEYEEEKPRFRLFGGRSRKADPEDEYERYAETQDYEDDDGDAVGLDGILTGVLGFLMVIALAAAVFAGITLLQSGKSEAAEAAPVTEAPAVVETMPPTEAEMQATQTAPEATPEPTGSKAVLTAEGILVPGERGPVVPERDVKKSIEEFATVTMIGNSFVEGMKLWSDINCEYVCADGVSLDNMIGNHLYFVTVRDYDAIYLTLGLNEIGWPVDSFISKYEKVIDYIRSDAYSKTATIYVTSVMPVEKIMETQKAESGQTINLSKIQTFNEALKEMCQRKGVWYMDVYSALADAEGYLPPEIGADDHVHFEKTGYRIWTEYLQNHYVDESLVEG